MWAELTCDTEWLEEHRAKRMSLWTIFTLATTTMWGIEVCTGVTHTSQSCTNHTGQHKASSGWPSKLDSRGFYDEIRCVFATEVRVTHRRHCFYTKPHYFFPGETQTINIRDGEHDCFTVRLVKTVEITGRLKKKNRSWCLQMGVAAAGCPVGCATNQSESTSPGLAYTTPTVQHQKSDFCRDDYLILHHVVQPLLSYIMM